MNSPTQIEAAAWRQQAPALAVWAMKFLVNRRDVWAAYNPLPDRAQWGAVRTAPRKRMRGKEVLTADILACHFRGRRPQDIVALHAISDNDLSKWIGWDIDQHEGAAPVEVMAANLKAACALVEYLSTVGIRAILEDSNGNGGHHVLALLAEPIPSPVAFAFSRTAIADSGLRADTESFPKQASAANRFGNVLRVFGRHHDGRRHWSRFWNGDGWLCGEEAVSYVLSAPVNDPSPIAVCVEQRGSAPGSSPPTSASSTQSTIPTGGRNNALTSIAGFLRSRQLNHDSILRALNVINAEQCDPPLSAAEVERIVDSVMKYRNDDKPVQSIFENVDLLMESWNSQFAIVPLGNKAMVAVKTAGTYEFFAPAQFKMLYLPVLVWVPGEKGRHLKTAADVWLTHPRRRQFSKAVFAPGAEPRADVLNLFTGFAVTPIEGDCSLFLEHVRDHICGGSQERFEFVMMWAAQIFQHPMRKIGAALVLRGKPGVGKTIFGRTLGVLLGRHYQIASQPRHVTGHFNRLLEVCLLLQAEEAFWAGDKEAEGTLKNLITNDILLIERKGIDAYDAPNYTRLLVTSNAEWVIPAALEERRFSVLDVSGARIQDTAYFAAMEEQLQNGGYGALLSMLLNWKIDENVLRHPLRTAALVEQQVASLNAEQAWLLDLLTRGVLPGDLAGAGSSPTQRLYESYVRHAKDVGRPRRAIETMIGSFLRKAIPAMSKRRGPFFIGNEERFGPVLDFPSLADSRGAFERYLGAENLFDGEKSEDWGVDGDAASDSEPIATSPTLEPPRSAAAPNLSLLTGDTVRKVGEVS
jgi:uncharacterized protein DUF5906/primase-like protein/TOTE conflict system primase-like protein